jgi:hypothetical protein
MFRFSQHDNEKQQLIRVIREIRGLTKGYVFSAEYNR